MAVSDVAICVIWFMTYNILEVNLNQEGTWNFAVSIYKLTCQQRGKCPCIQVCYFLMIRNAKFHGKVTTLNNIIGFHRVPATGETVTVVVNR